MEKLKDFAMQNIRTYAPIIVGTVLSWLSRKTGFIVDDQTRVTVILYFTGFLMGLYYLIVSMAEKFILPHLGAVSWLLLDFRKGNTAPIYPDKQDKIVIPTAGEIANGAEVKVVSPKPQNPPPGD